MRLPRKQKRDLRYLGAAQAFRHGMTIGICPCKWGFGFPVGAYYDLAEDDPGPMHLLDCKIDEDECPF